MFRNYGEAYITSYQPSLRVIRLIRAVRVCRSPALGGHRLTCPDCAATWYRYFSCGHSYCPLCQGNKREAWYERLRGKLLEVPYCHITFTVPHELNGICRLHPQKMYTILFHSAWQSLRELCAEENRVGGLPGMTAVLHTWGSDLKQHVHIHCLVTYGGLDEKAGKWRWPHCKNKLLRHRPLRNRYKDHFLAALHEWMTDPDGNCTYHASYAVLTADLLNKTWVVNQQPPTADPEVIGSYLSRYISRVGISDNRVVYDATSDVVRLEFKDYRKQKAGQAAPLAYRNLPPLVAMASILRHVLPAYFQRSRHYGLHAHSTYQRVKANIPVAVRRSAGGIRLIFLLLKHLLKTKVTACDHCGSLRPVVRQLVLADGNYMKSFTNLRSRSPPPAQPKALGEVNTKAA